MIFAVFHDYPGPEYGLPKLHNFPWLSRPRGHPVKYWFWGQIV